MLRRKSSLSTPRASEQERTDHEYATRHLWQETRLHAGLRGRRDRHEGHRHRGGPGRRGGQAYPGEGRVHGARPRLRGAEGEAHEQAARGLLQEGWNDGEAYGTRASLRRGFRRQVGGRADAEARRDFPAGPARRRARDDARARVHRRHAALELRRQREHPRYARESNRATAVRSA